jgi:hypothetical protein
VVTLNGTNFTWATRVLFNGVSAEFSHAPDLEYDRRLTAILPANATSGPITIETAFGNVTSTASFTALVPPQMTIRAFPSNVVELSWPSISGFGLQRADSLTATTVWATASTLSARLSNGVRYVTVTNAVPNRFFRLYRP